MWWHSIVPRVEPFGPVCLTRLRTPHPLLATGTEQPQLIVWTPSHIRSLETKTGQLLWSEPCEVTMGVSIATPIVHADIVFVSGYWEGTRAIRLDRKSRRARLIWEENRYLRGLMSQPLSRNGLVYLLDKQYGLTCLDIQTGRKLWDDDNRLTPRGRNPQASLVWINEGPSVLALNSNGELVMATLTPDAYEEQARAKIIGPTWAHPAYCRDLVMARSDTELICVRLPLVRE